MAPTDGPTHERTDANVRAVALAGAALAAVTVLALGVVLLQMRVLGRHAAEGDRPPSPIAEAAGAHEPPEPRLQTAPATDLAAMRTEENAVLGSYGWVDRREGVVRIPIEQAKRLVAEGQR